MREGLSPRDWVEKNDRLLQDLQFQYLEGKVIDEERKDDTVSVTDKVRVFVVIGEVRPVERYTLVDGTWLIDGHEIHDDPVIGKRI